MNAEGRTTLGDPAVLRNREIFTLIFSVIIAAIAVRVHAEPFVPQHDRQVLERVVPGYRFDPQILTDSAPPTTAIQLAREYIDLGRRFGDPRYHGRAEALLRPLWRMRPPPSQALVLRAIIRQHRHEFNAALQDLDVVLNRQPQNPQALLSRAMIYLVIGDHASARTDCLALLRFIKTYSALTCLAGVASFSGQAEAAHDVLLKVFDSDLGKNVEQRRWTIAWLADIAVRLGWYPRADRYFEQAVQLGQPSIHVLTQYAEYLLDTKRFEKATALLEHRQNVDALLLLRIRAMRQLKLPGVSSYVSQLKDRLETGRRRGSAHPSTEAQLYLHLLQRPLESLPLALENWRDQREPRDARLVLEAALAARRPDAAQPVIDWLRRSRLEDVRLDSLRRRLRNL